MINVFCVGDVLLDLLKEIRISWYNWLIWENYIMLNLNIRVNGLDGNYLQFGVKNIGQFLITTSLVGTPMIIPMICISMLCIWVVKEGIEVVAFQFWMGCIY